MQTQEGTGRLSKRERNNRASLHNLSNIIEQVNEWQATLYLSFIDFEEAFDSVHRESTWIMRKYGNPGKIFYENFDQGEICSWFSIKTGVNQG